MRSECHDHPFSGNLLSASGIKGWLALDRGANGQAFFSGREYLALVQKQHRILGTVYTVLGVQHSALDFRLRQSPCGVLLARSGRAGPYLRRSARSG